MRRLLCFLIPALTLLTLLVMCVAPSSHAYPVLYHIEIVNTYGDSIGGFDSPTIPTADEIMARYPDLFGSGDPFTEPKWAVVYDVSGRRIRTLAQETLAAGTHARGWDGRDDQGNGVAAGIYLVKLETGEKVLTEKVVRIR